MIKLEGFVNHVFVCLLLLTSFSLVQQTPKLCSHFISSFVDLNACAKWPLCVVQRLITTTPHTVNVRWVLFKPPMFVHTTFISECMFECNGYFHFRRIVSSKQIHKLWSMAYKKRTHRRHPLKISVWLCLHTHYKGSLFLGTSNCFSSVFLFSLIEKESFSFFFFT